MAGQVIMKGFVGWRIPAWVRRVVTMIPAFFVVWAGYDATRSLVISQVVLSLALPVPMIALLVLSYRREIMGAMAASKLTMTLSITPTLATLSLNALLLAETIGLPIGL